MEKNIYEKMYKYIYIYIWKKIYMKKCIYIYGKID